MKIKNTKLGFTLIELLVVITIIGILATGAVSVYTSQIQKSRDTTRITSIKALQSWIEQYYQDKYVYPLSWGFVWSGWVQAYTPWLAEDPKHGQPCIDSECAYSYVVAADSNGITQWAYEVSTAFENSWNHLNKADDDNDNWDDDARLELGVPTTETLDSSVAKDSDVDDTIITTTNLDEEAVVFKKWWVIVKP